MYKQTTSIAMKNFSISSYFITLLAIFLLFGCSGSKNENYDGYTHDFINSPISAVYIPIVEIELNGKPQYWVIDTGANLSVVDNGFYENHEDDFEYLDNMDMTLNGVSSSVSYISTYLNGIIGKGEDTINHQFITSDLSSVRQNIKENLGISIAGILGSDFLDKYDYVVDFKYDIIYRQTMPLDSILKN